MIILDATDLIEGDAAAATVVDYTIYGLDEAAAAGLKNLADGQLAATKGTLYTAGASDPSLKILVILVNTDTSARAVNLYMKPSGGTSRRIIPKDLSLGIGYSLRTDGVTLQIHDASGVLQVAVAVGDHGQLTGLTDDDHTQYIKDSEFTAADEVMVGTGSGTFGQVTLAASQFLAKKATGAATNVTATEARAILNVEDGATADQTGAEIKTAYEAEADTNAYTDAEKTKLAGVEASADVTDATNVNAAGAVMEADFNAQTVLAATTDNTPVALTVGEQTVVGRITGGNIAALTVAQLLTLIFSVDLPENISITLDDALSADGKWCGIAEDGVAGATLAFGDCIYFAVADSRWELTDADAEATAFGKVGICILAAANDASATKVLLWGKVRADTAFPALTIGAPVFIGTTAGDIQTTAPSGSGDIVRVIGYGNTADELFLCPDKTWLEIA